MGWCWFFSSSDTTKKDKEVSYSETAALREISQTSCTDRTKLALRTSYNRRAILFDLFKFTSICIVGITLSVLAAKHLEKPKFDSRFYFRIIAVLLGIMGYGLNSWERKWVKFARGEKTSLVGNSNKTNCKEQSKYFTVETVFPAAAGAAIPYSALSVPVTALLSTAFWRIPCVLQNKKYYSSKTSYPEPDSNNIPIGPLTNGGDNTTADEPLSITAGEQPLSITTEFPAENKQAAPPSPSSPSMTPGQTSAEPSEPTDPALYTAQPSRTPALVAAPFTPGGGRRNSTAPQPKF